MSSLEAWPEFLAKNRRSHDPTPPLLLCLDPGETVGWAVFDHGLLTREGQLKVQSTHLLALSQLISGLRPTMIVCEDYKVYAHRAAQHVGSKIPTVQVIGAIRLTAETLGVPIHFQMAYQAKGFCQDDKLLAWGLYKPNHRHANDAIRHGCYYLLFHREYARSGQLAR